MYYAIEIEGLPPGLVMNNSEQMGAKITPDRAVEAERFAYRLPASGKAKKGELCIPGRCLKASVLSICTPFKITLGGKRVHSKRWIASGSRIAPEDVGLGVEKYEVWISQYVVDRKRITKAHPRIFPWKASFKLVFTEGMEVFNEIATALKPQMLEIWTLAGIQAGLLDNRPGSPKKPGEHGTFKVIKCELME